MSSSSSNRSNISEQCVEMWAVRVWASKQKHLPKDSVVKKIQREKKQHRHGITIGPLVTHRGVDLIKKHLLKRVKVDYFVLKKKKTNRTNI